MCCAQYHQLTHVFNVQLLKLSASACLERLVVKIVRFSMSGLCCGQICQFPALLECVVVKIVSFSMSCMYRGKNCPFQHVWYVSWRKIVSFSMSGICCGQNHQFQHVWNGMCCGHYRQ
jgi:hypothetical protein